MPDSVGAWLQGGGAAHWLALVSLYVSSGLLPWVKTGVCCLCLIVGLLVYHRLYVYLVLWICQLQLFGWFFVCLLLWFVCCFSFLFA